MRLLTQLSERHQVIAFTCHPWLRECFEAEGARVMELAPGGTTPAISRAGAVASPGLAAPARRSHEVPACSSYALTRR